MACEQSQLLSAYADGELSGPAAASLRDHAAACPACSAELDELGALNRLMNAARQAALSRTDFDGVRVDDVMARLQAHVRDLVETTDLSLLRLARIFSGVAASVLIAGLWLVTRPAAAPPVQQARVGVNDLTVFVADPSPAAGESGGDRSAGERFGAASADQNQVEPTDRERALDALFGDNGAAAAAGGLAGRAGAEVELP